MPNLLVYATALQAKWEQRRDPSPGCDHLSLVSSLVVLSQDGYVTSTYHCRECGEEIVRTYKTITSNKPPID